MTNQNVGWNITAVEDIFQDVADAVHSAHRDRIPCSDDSTRNAVRFRPLITWDWQ
jgi:hypothetical protein